LKKDKELSLISKKRRIMAKTAILKEDLLNNTFSS